MLRAVCLSVLLVCSADLAAANARLTVLLDVLRVGETVEILREEGFAYAAQLEQDMLDGRGGAFWEAQLRRIYAPEQITEAVRDALDMGLSPEQVEAAIAFFGTTPGSRIIDLENEARRAMAAPDVEEAARAVFARQLADDTPRARFVTAFMSATDLIERNVAGVMSANLRFYTGLADGGYTDQTRTEIIAGVWADMDAIWAETESWLGSFLFLAYDPLTQEDLGAYLDFMRTPAGEALMAAFFEGFEGVSRDISYALGRAVALNADGDEI